MTLIAEELLAGGSITHKIEIPEDILYPKGTSDKGKNKDGNIVVLKPLTIKDIQLIAKAAKDNDILISTLMLKQSLVEPGLTIEQISSLHGGLVKFLIEKINQISGLSTPKNDLIEMVQAPMAKACFILAKEFGWTPQEVSEMTIGQILIYLEMVNQNTK